MSATKTAPAIHATAFVLATPAGARGLLVTGLSGAGKSALALALVDEWHAHSRFSALVADDLVILRAAHDRLLALPPTTAPPELRGKAERRGLGIVSRPHLARAVMHLHVALADRHERMPDPGRTTFEGVALPRLDVPRLDGPHGANAVAIVRDWLLEGAWTGRERQQSA